MIKCLPFLLLLANPAYAADTPSKAAICLSCHAIDYKKVGPAYKDVAAKRTEKQIIQSIKKGSKGKWVKGISMPSFKHLSDEDIKLLAKWVKAQNKGNK